MYSHPSSYLLALLILFMSCEQRDSAGGNTIKDAHVLISRLKVLDQPLPAPQVGDWLYSNNEKGQSLEQYKRHKPVKPDALKKVIYIQPLGTFSQQQDSIIEYTRKYLEIFFGLPATRLPTQSDFTPVLSGRRQFADGAQQLLTTTILNHLHQNLPNDAIVMLAITSADLYGGPQYNFVFGQARARHRVAVSSLSRYSSSPEDSISDELVLERITKTSAHEIAHMFSCQHCINAICLMNGSNTLTESDARPNRLCSECHMKLQWNLGFEVETRIRRLGEFFKKHKLQEDYLLAAQELTLIRQ
jgi:archaemetzincin